MCGARFFSSADGFSSPYLGRFISTAIDPVEKKPLYHWRPGTRIMSLGSVGCNMICAFCQNHSISHPARRPPPGELNGMSPEALAVLTKKNGLSSVAYTYNEPALQGEYIVIAAHVLNDSGIASAIVTNGIFSPAFSGEISRVISAANVDVKTFAKAREQRIAQERAIRAEKVAKMQQATRGDASSAPTGVAPLRTDEETE
jgi:pyruvate formate lyase activating enzyme